MVVQVVVPWVVGTGSARPPLCVSVASQSKAFVRIKSIEACGSMPPPPQARYRWAAYAFSPGNGGWVRFNFGARTETEGWTFVEQFWDLMVLAGDYETVDVKRTICF